MVAEESVRAPALNLFVTDVVFLWNKACYANSNVVASPFFSDVHDGDALIHRADAASSADVGWRRWQPAERNWMLAMVARTASSQADATDVVKSKRRNIASVISF